MFSDGLRDNLHDREAISIQVLFWDQFLHPKTSQQSPRTYENLLEFAPKTIRENHVRSMFDPIVNPAVQYSLMVLLQLFLMLVGRFKWCRDLPLGYSRLYI